MQSSWDNHGKGKPQEQPKPNGQEESEGLVQQQQLDENNLKACQKMLEELDMAVETAKLNVQRRKHLKEFSHPIVQSQHINRKEQNHGEEDVSQTHELEETMEEQFELPIHRQMIVQLPKETWFEILAFLLPRPRCLLAQIVPQIGDRQFASIVQSFLHDYDQITLDYIAVEDPQLHAWPQFANPYEEHWRVPDVEMPANIKDFKDIKIWYLDTSVLYFLRIFHQKFLFCNINLELERSIFPKETDMDAQLTALSYVLPLIRSINSIQLLYITQLGDLYNANSELAIDMLKMARILCIYIHHYEYWAGSEEWELFFGPEHVDLLNRWLYTPRNDGKPRVLILIPDMAHTDIYCSKIRHFIDNSIKVEFSKAKSACSFFIRLILDDDFEWPGDICMENAETNEKLVVKKVASNGLARYSHVLDQKMALISRYPLNADKRWIEPNEKEALEWDFAEQYRRIELGNPVQTAIPWSAKHNSHRSRETHYRSIRHVDSPACTNNGRDNQGSSRASHF